MEPKSLRLFFLESIEDCCRGQVIERVDRDGKMPTDENLNAFFLN